MINALNKKSIHKGNEYKMQFLFYERRTIEVGCSSKSKHEIHQFVQRSQLEGHYNQFLQKKAPTSSQSEQLMQKLPIVH